MTTLTMATLKIGQQARLIYSKIKARDLSSKSLQTGLLFLNGVGGP
jgi:hypothetical protein